MVLIIDPQVSGLAGNMFIGAFIDIGADKDKIIDVMKTYSEDFGDVKIDIKKQPKNGIMSTYAEIIAEDNNKARHYKDIIEKLDMITEEKYPDDETIAKTIALTKKIFKTIANAECKAHGMSIDEIHFHEVGNTDAICDVIGASYAYHLLGLDKEKVYSLPIATGYGTVNTQHGLLPVPAPAVINILGDVPTQGGVAKTELTTPTGAAIAVNIVDEFITTYPQLGYKKVGYGAGRKDLEILNALRLIHAESITPKDTITTLETNVDTLPGEVLGSLYDVLLNEGASDVSITPTFMKKNRPGYIIKVICRNHNAAHLCDVLIKHTGTLGVRMIPTMHRAAVVRKNVIQQVEVEGIKEDVRFKIGYSDDMVVKCSPEYDDIKKLADKTDIPIKDLMEIVKIQYLENNKGE